MVFDGFYPYYFQQPRRILFVGREARQIGGQHNMDVLWEAYREGKKIGGRSLNRDGFHRRLLYVSYGIVHQLCEWNDIPYATEIGNTFGESSGLSFAFMNISKLSNENDDFRSECDVIRSGYSASTKPRNFISEEVSTLEPHIVITMNLGEMIHGLGVVHQLDSSPDVDLYRLTHRSGQSLLLNTWHFAAPNRSDLTRFYLPICNAIRRHSCAVPLRRGTPRFA